MNFPPRIFTFYSYKGGVGRSMALLNMAYYLHARGRHVLVVDIDLEAPGASGFLHRSKELLPQQDTGDVVDLLAEVVEAVRNVPEGTELPPLQLRLEDFLRRVDPEKYAAAVHPKAPRARLDVLAADDTRDYTTRLSELDLTNLSAGQITDVSDLLRGVLIRYSFPFQQPWQEEGAAPEDTRYDYILVDSRTGLSEIGGLCIGPLSDRLIVLCGLNDQNIEGTRQFLEIVGLRSEARAASAEAWDDADPPAEEDHRPATLGPKPTLLVASPVPGGEMTYKKLRMEVLEKQLGIPPVKLSYHPQMALMETLFVRDHVDEYLALEYAALARRMMSMVGDTESQLLAPIHRLTATRPGKEDVEPDSIQLTKRLARSALASGQADYGIPSSIIAHLGLPIEVQDQIRKMQINLAPTDEYAALLWLNWADALDTHKSRQSGDPAAFQSMDDKYRMAVTLNPQYHRALNNWGASLAEWASTKEGSAADALFAQSCEKYQQATALQPDDHETLYNWGIALSEWANIKKETEADTLFAQSCEKYREAAAIQPNDHGTFYNWGTALSDWAETKVGDEADVLYTQSCEKYHLAAALLPNELEMLCNWGFALMSWAKTKVGAEADALFNQAEEKYRRALEIQSDYPEVLFSLGCLHGLRGEMEEVEAALKQWKAATPDASKSALDDDSDFDRVRNDPRFQALRAGLAG